MPTTLKNEAAIVGIGQTEFSKNSGRSELQLACEAVNAAIVEVVKGIDEGRITPDPSNVERVLEMAGL